MKIGRILKYKKIKNEKTGKTVFLFFRKQYKNIFVIIIIISCSMENIENTNIDKMERLEPKERMEIYERMQMLEPIQRIEPKEPKELIEQKTFFNYLMEFIFEIWNDIKKPFVMNLLHYCIKLKN